MTRHAASHIDHLADREALSVAQIIDAALLFQFPLDPLAEDPQYVLTIVDSESFAEGVEKLFPRWTGTSRSRWRSPKRRASHPKRPKGEEEAIRGASSV